MNLNNYILLKIWLLPYWTLGNRWEVEAFENMGFIIALGRPPWCSGGVRSYKSLSLGAIPVRGSRRQTPRFFILLFGQVDRDVYLGNPEEGKLMQSWHLTFLSVGWYLLANQGLMRRRWAPRPHTEKGMPPHFYLRFRQVRNVGGLRFMKFIRLLRSLFVYIYVHTLIYKFIRLIDEFIRIYHYFLTFSLCHLFPGKPCYGRYGVVSVKSVGL